MYDNNFPPLTFSDLTKAVQRESWGLGQVTCPDGSQAPDTLSCLPVNTNIGANQIANTIFGATASAAEQPYYQNIFGLQVPTSVLVIGVVGLIALAAAMGGRR